jgi:CheY-like chemotaxis protein
MPEGGAVTIETRTVTIDEAFLRTHGFGELGDFAQIAFSDTGIGMDEATRRQIFQPFFTTKEVGKGTGLGLAMGYGIVKQHNGFINVFSEPGRGTTFRVYLPLARTSLDRAAAPDAAKPLPGGSETVLLAEDDEILRTLTGTLLENAGYQVMTACDGLEAMSLFLGNPEKIRLCLFDMIMPKQNGWEAFREIRDLRTGIPALFMSGYQPDEARLAEMARAGAAFILKPVRPRDLLLKVRELLDRREDASPEGRSHVE